MRIVVTGGSGKAGRWVVRDLREHLARCLLTDRDPVLDDVKQLETARLVVEEPGNIPDQRFDHRPVGSHRRTGSEASSSASSSSSPAVS